MSTSLQPGDSSENPAIEAQPAGSRRPVAAWLAAYPFAWAALGAVANIFWYPPAGLRLGALWLLPRRVWWVTAALEIAVRLGLAWYNDAYASRWGLLAGAAVPWCIYALTLRALGRPGRGTPSRSALPRLLGVGFAAAVVNSIVLTGIDLNDDGGLRAGLPAMLVSYALGDFAGIVLVVPVMLALHDQAGPDRMPWSKLLANGLVLAPAGVLLGFLLLPRIEAPVYPVALALLPLFLIAHRHGWRQAAIAFALLGLALRWAPLPMAHTLEPGQMPLLIAMTGCAVLLLGVAIEGHREQRDQLSKTVRALSDRGGELARAANRMASLQEQERRRIGTELHDQLGQDMTAIATRLRIVELTASNPAVLEGLASISGLLADAHQHLREVINELHPAVLDRFGLARAIAEGPFAQMLRDRGILYSSMIQGKVDLLPDNVASVLYRICQEAATNCARHGCGGRMHIRLRLAPAALNGELLLEIEDQAGAIDVDPERPGRGLLNIRDRAHAIGAEYAFNAASGMPRHHLSLWMPLPEEPRPSDPDFQPASL